MVKTVGAERNIGSESWIAALAERFPAAEREALALAYDWAQRKYAGQMHPDGAAWIDHVRGVAEILGALRLDGESLVAALLLGCGAEEGEERERLQRMFGARALSLVHGVASMTPIQALRGRADLVARSSGKSAQLEALRKMLLAMVQDVRVVLIKLADQVQLLRHLAAAGGQRERQEAAQDTLELFAPLANRLGVWQLKWELEDLSLRCQDPVTYKSIARRLDEKRIHREAYIEAVVRLLRQELARAGVRAEVTGRPKHIYSIWKKMQRKRLDFEKLSDVRGVRVLVDDIKDCYAVLGVVHDIWTPVPGEFDDYIVKPKSNDYRSLHTAVLGPENRVLEVQIRTHDMHRHAEFGVAAHWRYKEESHQDATYDPKISWLRKILGWREELPDTGDLAESFRTELFEDSVYVLTPQGRVIDLPRGATPVDFAYHVHSELGHRCRGAKVNGQMVPLNHALSNGQVVEIIAAKEGGPSRDWLNPQLGFIRSNRARSKVRQWFHNLTHEQSVAEGRAQVEKELARLGRSAMRLEDLAFALGFGEPDGLFSAYSRGEITARQLQTAVRGDEVQTAVEPAAAAALAVNKSQAGASGILIVGVDKLLTQLARCCKPAPPDPIIGFVTRGRGVTVHRSGCSNVARLPSERLIVAEWGRQVQDSRFAVDVEILGGSQPTVMRDVLDVLSREKARVVSSSSHARDLSARIALTMEVDGLVQLERLLKLIRDLPGVAHARRR